jgi:ABC-type transporter Mla MlaB component
MNRFYSLVKDGQTLSLKGEVYFDNVMPLWQDSLILFKNLSEITISFDELAHSDSSILALCIEWLRESRRQNKNLGFINLPSFLKDLVRVHGLDTILPIQ